MATYIGQIAIGTTTPALIGSTLYGICATTANVAAKTVTATVDYDGKFINHNFDTALQGVTIHVKFKNGNTVSSGLTLQVGTSAATAVVGNCICEPDTILAFTFNEEQKWEVNGQQYIFKSSYDSTSSRIITENDLHAAAYKDVIDSLTGNLSSTALPTAEAVVLYVQDQTGGLAGLTGAMHFRGSVTSVPDATATTTYDSYISGDVILGPGDKEYVYVKGASVASSTWVELGDESDYALKSSTTSVVGNISITAVAPTLETTAVVATQITSISAGSAADLQTTTYTIPNVTTAGTATTASVTAGILTLFIGTDTELGTDFTIHGVSSFTANVPTTFTSTSVSVTSVTNWDDGEIATITATSVTVVVPDSNPVPTP